VAFGSPGSRRERRQDGSRPEMAPQRLEKIESGPGNGMGPETLDPQYLVHGRAADRARLRLTNREKDKVAEKGAQRFEIARCRTEIGARGASLVRRDWLRGLERPTADRRLSRAPGRSEWAARGGKFSWLQSLEKSQNRKGILAAQSA